VTGSLRWVLRNRLRAICVLAGPATRPDANPRHWNQVSTSLGFDCQCSIAPFVFGLSANEVSTTRVSGWVNPRTLADLLIPSADADGTDFGVPTIN
jgi:hypothetical protein